MDDRRARDAIVTATSPSTRQLLAHVGTILDRNGNTDLIGIWSPRRRDWPDEIRPNGRTFRVVWCETPLAAREAVVDTISEDTGLVIVTSLDEKALGTDLVARMARRRLQTIDPWQILKDAFHAKSFDPRLDGKRWFAETLLELAPPEGYPPVSGGLLDRETVWRHLLEKGIGLTPGPPAVSDLLKWTMREEGPSRFSGLRDEAKEGIADYVAEVAEPAGLLIMSDMLLRPCPSAWLSECSMNNEARRAATSPPRAPGWSP